MSEKVNKTYKPEQLTEAIELIMYTNNVSWETAKEEIMAFYNKGWRLVKIK